MTFLGQVRSVRAVSPLVLFSVLLAVGCVSSDLSRGDRLADEGQWDQAVVAFREAVKRDPLDPAVQQRLDRAKLRAAEMHHDEGVRRLEEQQLAEALREIKLALGLIPSHPEFRASLDQAVRLKQARDEVQAADKLLGLGRPEDALAAYERAVELDPNRKDAVDGIVALTQQQRAATLTGRSSEPITLQFQNTKLKEVFEILARTVQLNVVFDKDVKDDPVTVFVHDLSFDEALQLILTTHGMSAQKIASDTLLILPANKQKQAQYQDLMIRAFYLSNAKAKDAVTLLKTLLDSKRIHVDEGVNAVIIRDEPAKVRLAERLLAAVDRPEPEVELDVEVLEVNRTKSLKYGLNYAKQAGAGIVPSGSSGGLSTSPIPFTYSQLTSLGPSSYLFTLPASVLADFFKQESDAKTLASPKLRVINGKAATVNIGDKQPILLSTTNVLPGQAATGAIPTTSTVTSIEFKDTGVKLTVEPTIHLMDNVTLKLKIEVTRLGDQITLQSSPEIKQFKFGTRTVETSLMLKDDETVVLAGLIQNEDRKTKTTVPWLGDLPLIGHLFSSTTVDSVTTEVVLTITPRILRGRSTATLAAQGFWSGTESTFATQPLYYSQPVSFSAPPVASPAVYVAPFSQPAREVEPSGVPMPLIEPTQGPALSPAPPAPLGLTGVPPGSPPLPNASEPPSGGELLARAPTAITFQTGQTTTTVNQEFSVGLITLQPEQINEGQLRVIFDPTRLEFRRAESGATLVSAQVEGGTVVLHLKASGQAVLPGSALATLVFQSTVGGESTITLEPFESGGQTRPASPTTIQRLRVLVR